MAFPISNFETEVPVGTMNGINRNFTVQKTPRAILLNGLYYESGYGYTYTEPTITVDSGLAPNASSTFFSIQLNTQGYASSTPLYIQDSGNISLGLAILITILSIVLIAFLKNNIIKKRKWS